MTKTVQYQTFDSGIDLYGLLGIITYVVPDVRLSSVVQPDRTISAGGGLRSRAGLRNS
ncbi:MAG: hypothetical protein OQK05_14605 [Pseudopelagicola sp.]|nr:hypothetical protein [Pseudopelagicola sp.]